MVYRADTRVELIDMIDRYYGLCIQHDILVVQLIHEEVVVSMGWDCGGVVGSTLNVWMCLWRGM